MKRNSVLVALLQTLTITAGGWLLVSLVSRPTGMSDAQLVIGPVSVALLWFGMRGRPKAV